MHQPTLPLRAKRALCLISLVVCGGAQAQAVQAMTVKRNTDLKKAPEPTAEVVMPLQTNHMVTHAGERQGAWMRVKADNGKQGWMKLFDLSAAPTGAAADSGSATKGIGGLFGTSRPKAATSTLGIRGLDANDLAQAQPNPGAVTQGEKLRVSENQARQFAQRSGLNAKPVDDLPPTRPGSPTQNAN